MTEAELSGLKQSGGPKNPLQEQVLKWLGRRQITESEEWMVTRTCEVYDEGKERVQ